MVLLYKGTIINKWSHNDLPQASQLNAPLNLLTIGHEPESNIWEKIVLILLGYVLPLILLIIADRFWAWSVWVRKKEEWVKQKEQWLIKQEREQAEKMFLQAEKAMGNAGKAVSQASKSVVDRLKKEKGNTPPNDKSNV